MSHISRYTVRPMHVTRASTVLLTLTAVMTVGAGAQTSAGTFDRTKPPVVPAPRPLTFPKAQTRKLKNGISIIIMEDHTRPVVSVSVVVRVSGLVEPDNKIGVGDFVGALMREGTTKHTAEQLSEEFAALGNGVSATGFYTIPANVDRSLDLMAEQFLVPAFPQRSLDRVKANRIARLQRAKEQPEYIAEKILFAKLYGKDHPYSREITPETIAAITRDDLLAYYNTYYKPPNIKLVVAGDITPEQAVIKLNRIFGDLAKGESGERTVAPVKPVTATRIYIYDRPGSSQSIIATAQMGPRRDSPDVWALREMSTAFGGAFNSRLNLNLREQHQYAYEANGGFSFRRPPEPSTFAASAAVATAKTDSALIETMKEINGIRTTKPMTAEELAFAKAAATKSLPLEFETIGQRAGAIARLVADDEPLDYYNTFVQKIEGVTLSKARNAATKYLAPDKMVIIVVGDRKTIEAGIRAANTGPVEIVDSI